MIELEFGICGKRIGDPQISRVKLTFDQLHSSSVPRCPLGVQVPCEKWEDEKAVSKTFPGSEQEQGAPD